MNAQTVLMFAAAALLAGCSNPCDYYVSKSDPDKSPIVKIEQSPEDKARMEKQQREYKENMPQAHRSIAPRSMPGRRKSATTSSKRESAKPLDGGRTMTRTRTP